MQRRLRDKEIDTSQFARPEGVDARAILTVIRVPREWEKWRLDRVVHATFHRMSRTRAQQVIDVGAFAPDGRRLRASSRVRFDDLVLLYRPPFEEPDVPLDMPVVFEDEHLLAIDKPSGLPVHPTARYHHKTVTARLAVVRPDEFFALCHRIDRETSGVLLIAKDRDTERLVKKALETHDAIQKRYLAITWGVPFDKSGRIALSLALDETHRFRVKMKICDADAPDAQHAATRYEVLGVRRARGDASRRYALIACDLETGRQHQIRAHLTAIGAPIVGDKLYGPDDELFARGADGTLTEDDLALLELPRHALHAHRLGFDHPRKKGERVTIVAALPRDLQEFWDALVDVGSGEGER
ncbi:MAG: RluA family pseudouridine synthase [Polyangiales bacterium]